ncbi:hypothetical protein BC828DRAFT_142152 [Blastocladiella britannica]|nr:hypothetical protein BC828DRAFT_142152 [Blastocladiella britannica]
MLSTPIKPSPERTTRTHLRSHNQGDVATSSPLSPMLGIGTRIAIASTTAHLRMPAAHDLPQTSATSSGASESNTEEHQYEAASQSMQQLQPEPAAPILPAVVDSQSVPKWLLGIPTITADDASLVDHGSSSSSSAGSSSTRSSSNAAMEEAQMMRRNPPPPPSSAATSAGPSRDPSPEPRSPVALALPVTLSLHRSASAGEVPSIPRGGGASDGGVDGDGPPNLGLGAPPINGFSSRPTSMATMNLTGKVASAVASSSPAAASTSLAKDLNPIQATALVGSPPGIALSRDWDGSGKSHASYSTSDSGDPARGATSKGATRPQHVRRQQPPQQQQQESGPTASISSTGMRGILAGGGSRRPVLAGGGSSLWASHSDRSIVGQSDMSAGSLSGRRTRRESETSEPGGQTGTMSSNSGRLQSSLNHPRSPTLDRLAPSGGGKRIDANQGPIISRLSESYRGQRSSRLSIRGSRQGGLISSGDVLGHRSSSTSMQSVPAVLRPFAHLWLKLDEIYQHQIHTPNTRFWSVWSSLILAIEVYNVFSVPFSMAWICHFTIAPYYMYFGYIIDLLLLVDVWLSMRQSFEDEYGVLITEPSEIRRHYLTQGHGTFAILGSIPFDLLALLPPLTRKEPLECTRIFFPGTATFGFFYDVTRIPGYLYAWSFLRLTRWFRVPKLLRRFASWNAKWVGGVTHMRLLKNFIVFLIAGHIDACLFFVLNVWEPIGTAWIDTIGIRNFTYVISLME